jgi:hypothetical protein
MTVVKVTDEVAMKDAWLKEAASFLENKSAQELYEIYRLLVQVELDDNNKDLISSAMRAHFEGKDQLAINTAKLLLNDENPTVRIEAYWLLKDIMFTNEAAIDMVFVDLLGDSDQAVFDQVYDWADDDFSEVKASFENLIYITKLFVLAKKRREAQTQAPR